MTTYKVYSGYNSPHLIKVRDLNGVKYPIASMATITRVKIKYIPAAGEDAEVIDSSLVDNVFDWATYAATGEICFDLGLLSITAGRDYTAEFTIYDGVYTSGRVLSQIDLYISDELGTGAIAVASSVLNITDDQVLTTGNLLQSICISATKAIALTLPSMGEDEDGKWIEISWDGEYSHTVTCADADTIGDDSATIMTLKSGTTYGNIIIKYYHSLLGWVVIRSGGISAI